MWGFAETSLRFRVKGLDLASWDGGCTEVVFAEYFPVSVGLSRYLAVGATK